MGKIRNPQYRIVVADARTKRDGRRQPPLQPTRPLTPPPPGLTPPQRPPRTPRSRPVPAPTRRSDVLRPALEHLVKGIVDHPDDVRVRMVDSRRGQRLEVRVHPEDLGTVIGRGGRTAKALRQVITFIGGRGVRVDIVDSY